MLNYFKGKMISFKIFFFIVLFLIAGKINFAQESNLQIFYSLIDSSALEIIERIKNNDKPVKLDFELGESYSVFKNQIIKTFTDNDFNVIISKDSNKNFLLINYVLDNAKVDYGDIYRDGLLGDYFLPRKVLISGNYLISSNPVFVNDFQFFYNDTVLVNNIKDLESYSFPFTRGKVLSEPFFSSLFEPLIAIGAAAIAVFLFFTIRSK